MDDNTSSGGRRAGRAAKGSKKKVKGGAASAERWLRAAEAVPAVDGPAQPVAELTGVEPVELAKPTKPVERVDEPVTARARRSSRFHSAAEDQDLVVEQNPFLPVQEVEAGPEGDAGADDLAPVMVTGPAAPTGAPAPADPLFVVPDQLPLAGAGLRSDVVVQVCGLHGGAGTSTVAALLGEAAQDCGVGVEGVLEARVPVVFVTRTNARGLSLARRLASQWASGGLQDLLVLGLVLVDDAPALSRELHRELKSAEKALPHSWRITWSEDLRHDPELPPPAEAGRRRRLCKSLLKHATARRPLPTSEHPGRLPERGPARQASITTNPVTTPH